VGGTAPPGTVAIVLAANGTLPFAGGTVLGRLLDQFADLEVAAIHVITRPAVADDLRAAVDGAGAQLHVSPDAAGDLRAVAEVAHGADGPLAIAHGDIVTHRESFAGLLADPRLASAILATTGPQGRPYAPRVRGQRGRLVSAGSPYHSVWRGSSSFLGVLKVSPSERPALIDSAQRLAELAAAPPAGWQEELAAKPELWRWRIATRELDREDEVAEEDLVLSDGDEAELRRRRAVAPDDVASLLLVGLVRGGARVGLSFLRNFFWARPLTREDADAAAAELATYDEDRLLLDQAVKGSDGFFTTFFVSPYSRYIARWAARVGLTPNQITLMSLFVGVLAAAAFATGERAGLAAGAILLQLAFTLDCVDGQLARYTRTFSKLGAWLDSMFDRTKEYIVFAGLAIGAARAGDDVWLLAGAALTLQTLRHTLEFSYGAARHEELGAIAHPPIEVPSDEPDRPPPRPRRAAAAAAAPVAPVRRSPLARGLGVWGAVERVPGVLWLKKMISFPIGERFAAISITAALFDARTTFTVMLAWGAIAALYTLTGRLLRSLSG
jgi:phosphatidylglycerophosphate synthase